MASSSMGNCYLCGATVSKTTMTNHLLRSHKLKAHSIPQGEEKCYLLKVEGVYDEDYWLYFDVPTSTRLWEVDEFLRKIWLECCHHMSAFYIKKYEQLDEDLKLHAFHVKDKLFHEYDFGTTTKTVITIVGETTRKKKKKYVRLLARNIPRTFSCASCGESATVICTESKYTTNNPFFCEACFKANGHDEFLLLPITNSPRMDECGYDGERDVFGFDPQKKSIIYPFK